jgi:SAM-dependent methyltransferase
VIGRRLSAALVRAVGMGERYRAFWAALEAMSRLGERWNVQWLTYNPLLFGYYHRCAVIAADPVMRTFQNVFPTASRYLDVGAGSGAYAAGALDRGRHAVACEHSRIGRALARLQGVEARPFDLLEEPPAHIDEPFDLTYRFEVAEHVDASLGDRLVEFIASQAPVAIFTAATPEQGGIGHVNPEPQRYWIDRFERAGMRHSPELSARVANGFREEGVPLHWLIDNVMVFSRTA